MVLIGRRPLNIELARIPVAALARRLRPEMHPDAELRIPQPLRRTRIVGLDRAPCRLVGARRHRQIEFLLGKSGHVTHRHRVLGQGAVHRRHRLQIVIHTRIRLSAARGEARPEQHDIQQLSSHSIFICWIIKVPHSETQRAPLPHISIPRPSAPLFRPSPSRDPAHPSSAHLHPAPAVFSGHTAPRQNGASRPPYNARGMRNCVIINLYKYIN